MTDSNKTFWPQKTILGAPPSGRTELRAPTPQSVDKLRRHLFLHQQNLQNTTSLLFSWQKLNGMFRKYVSDAGLKPRCKCLSYFWHLPSRAPGWRPAVKTRWAAPSFPPSPPPSLPPPSRPCRAYTKPVLRAAPRLLRWCVAPPGRARLRSSSVAPQLCSQALGGSRVGAEFLKPEIGAESRVFDWEQKLAEKTWRPGFLGSPTGETCLPAHHIICWFDNILRCLFTQYFRTFSVFPSTSVAASLHAGRSICMRRRPLFSAVARPLLKCSQLSRLPRIKLYFVHIHRIFYIPVFALYAT